MLKKVTFKSAVMFGSMWLILVLFNRPIWATNDESISGEPQPFTYTPEFANDFKRMDIDQSGVVVVTSNRFMADNSLTQSRLVIYSLMHDLSLEWITDDDVWANPIDSVVTDTGIYILYRTGDSKEPTEVAKFNRQDGALAWRKRLNDTPEAKGEVLQVEENNNTIAVAGVVNEITYVWWYDTSGTFRNHWSKDLGVSTGSPEAGKELIHALNLRHDNSAVVLSLVESEQGEIRVLRVSDDGQEIFDYARQAEVIMSSGEDFSLIASIDDRFMVSYSEENDFGLPRLNQVVLSDLGDELAFNKYEQLSRTSAHNTEELLQQNGQVFTTTKSSDFEDDFEFLQTDFNGINSGGFTYSYSGEGHGLKPTQINLGETNQLFIVSSINNPFPDPFTDTLYLQFSANGQLCSETQIDGSDFNSQVQFYQGNFYELRFIGEHVANGRVLHVVKHPKLKVCLSDVIFTSGFELIKQ